MNIIDKISDLLKKIVTCNNGNLSSKRLGGLLMLLSGTGVKLCLSWYGAKVKIAAKFTLYDKIDGTADSLILIGSALLGVGLFELMKKK